MSSAADPNLAQHADAAASVSLDAMLQDVLSREQRMLLRARWMQSSWWWLGALLAVVIGDALWQWHELGRFIGAAFLLLLAMALLARVYCTKMSPMPTTAQQLHAAATLEQHHCLSGQPIVNALWLARQYQHTSPSSLTHQLQQRSLTHATHIASQADIAGSVDRRIFLFHRTRFAVILVVWLLVALLMPRLVMTGVQRLVNPWGNCPPFSLTRFHISLPDGAIMQGSDVTVDITLTGQLPTTLDWVALKPSDEPTYFTPWRRRFVESQRWRLEPLSQGSYRHRLRELDQDLTFELQTDTGQSQRVTLRVEPRPVVASQPAPDETESPSPPVQTQPPATQSSSPQNQSVTSDNPDIQAAAAAMGALGVEAGKLALAAEQLKQQLQSQTPAIALTPEQQQSVNAIASQLEAFKRMTRDRQSELKNQHAAAADQTGDTNTAAGDQSQLLQMAQTLASLLTPKQPSLASADSATTTMTDTMAQAMSALVRAAVSDQQKLSQPTQASGNTAGASQNPSGETAAGHQAQPADPSGDTQQLRQGAYHQTGDHSANTTVQTQARSRGVPEMYRGQVERYFDRLNEDQSLQQAPPLHDGAIP